VSVDNVEEHVEVNLKDDASDDGVDGAGCSSRVVVWRDPGWLGAPVRVVREMLG
jgi:hypothetical protein